MLWLFDLRVVLWSQSVEDMKYLYGVAVRPQKIPALLRHLLQNA